MKKDEIIYRNSAEPHTLDSIQKRCESLESIAGAKIDLIRKAYLEGSALHGVNLEGNIENLIGAIPIPVGVAGPVLVNGEYANGNFYVPLATTEGAVVDSYTRGMWVISKSGGATVRVVKDIMHITPLFVSNGLIEAIEFSKWIETHFLKIKEIAESTTNHGKLLRIDPQVFANKIFLKFTYSTGDAMGLNLVNISVDHVCKWISNEWQGMKYYLRVNYSGDKKVSPSNFVNGYGKEVLVECTIPRKILTRFFGITPEQYVEYYQICVIGTMHAGILGINAHLANGLAAIYIACGQDVAQVTSSAVGVISYELNSSGDLSVSLRLPNILVGTVGGGTALPAQQEALNIMGCAGRGNAKKFAEIIGATLLAGEISIGAALTCGAFVDIHKKKHEHTKVT